uniref:Uncharacterized protein n=1 Tax=Rhipicephalus zambeziensis TaxID=60191 RepID=A0A224Y6T2_9ACAR
MWFLFSFSHFPPTKKYKHCGCISKCMPLISCKRQKCILTGKRGNPKLVFLSDDSVKRKEKVMPRKCACSFAHQTLYANTFEHSRINVTTVARHSTPDAPTCQQAWQQKHLAP